MIRILSFIITSLMLGQFAIARDGGVFYDEVFDKKGNLRPQYEGIYPELAKKSKAEQKEFLERSLRAYRGDNALNNLPLILTPEEYDQVIVPGVQQRARAILAFLADEFSGAKTYRAVLPEKVVEALRVRSGEMSYRGIVSPQNISFFYGPDLMRNSRGQNVVLEDNLGAVGLAFDLNLAHEFMLEHNPEILNYMKPRDPEDFYRKLAATYKAAAEKRGGKAVMLVSQVKTDGEDKRVREIFEELGVEIVYPFARDTKLVALDHGVYTYSKTKGMRSLEKVGYAILVGEPVWYDNSHPAARERSVVEESNALIADKDVPLATRKKLKALLAEDYSKEQIEKIAGVVNEYNPELLKPRAYPGLIDAILKNQVGTNLTPGTEFVSDKEFYIYVEELIRFYLDEEPILKNQPTWMFGNADGTLRKAVFKRCFDDFASYVIKAVDGRGGDGVFVGPNTKADQIPRIKELVKANPDKWECQEYMTPSRLGDLIIDRRAIANASLTGGRANILVSNVSASRGNSPKGSGKVNLSGNGRAITVLIPSCEQRLKRPKN